MIVTDTFRSPYTPVVIVFAVFFVLLCACCIAINVRIYKLKKESGEDKLVNDGKGQHVELSGFDTARSGADPEAAQVAESEKKLDTDGGDTGRQHDFGPATGRVDPMVEDANEGTKVGLPEPAISKVNEDPVVQKEDKMEEVKLDEEEKKE